MRAVRLPPRFSVCTGEAGAGGEGGIIGLITEFRHDDNRLWMERVLVLPTG